MTRRRSRAARGIRAHGAVPRNRGPVTTLLAGVSLAAHEPGDDRRGRHRHRGARHLYGARPAAGALAGDAVVVDNVGAHQPGLIGELVAAAGCELVFLPA